MRAVVAEVLLQQGSGGGEFVPDDLRRLRAQGDVAEGVAADINAGGLQRAGLVPVERGEIGEAGAEGVQFVLRIETKKLASAFLADGFGDVAAGFPDGKDGLGCAGWACPGRRPGGFPPSRGICAFASHGV